MRVLGMVASADPAPTPPREATSDFLGKLAHRVARDYPVIWSMRLDLVLMFAAGAIPAALLSAPMVAYAYRFHLDSRAAMEQALNYGFFGWTAIALLFAFFWAYRVSSAIRLPAAPAVRRRSEALLALGGSALIFIAPCLHSVLLWLIFDYMGASTPWDNDMAPDIAPMHITWVNFLAFVVGVFILVQSRLGPREAFISVISGPAASFGLLFGASWILQDRDDDLGPTLIVFGAELILLIVAARFIGDLKRGFLRRQIAIASFYVFNPLFVFVILFAPGLPVNWQIDRGEWLAFAVAQILMFCSCAATVWLMSYTRLDPPSRSRRLSARIADAAKRAQERLVDDGLGRRARRFFLRHFGTLARDFPRLWLFRIDLVVFYLIVMALGTLLLGVGVSTVPTLQEYQALSPFAWEADNLYRDAVRQFSIGPEDGALALALFVTVFCFFWIYSANDTLRLPAAPRLRRLPESFGAAMCIWLIALPVMAIFALACVFTDMRLAQAPEDVQELADYIGFPGEPLRSRATEGGFGTLFLILMMASMMSVIAVLLRRFGFLDALVSFVVALGFFILGLLLSEEIFEGFRPRIYEGLSLDISGLFAAVLIVLCLAMGRRLSRNVFARRLLYGPGLFALSLIGAWILLGHRTNHDIDETAELMVDFIGLTPAMQDHGLELEYHLVFWGSGIGTMTLYYVLSAILIQLVAGGARSALRPR